MEVQKLKEEADTLKFDIVKLLRDFEEKNGVVINLSVYHRFLTVEEEMKRCRYRVDGTREQIAEVNLTLNL